MEWAELVLEYVNALAWPVVVGGAVWAFRKQIAAKIGDLKEATTPVGGASFFDREAKEIEERADRAAEAQAEADAAMEAEEPQPEPEEATPESPTTQPTEPRDMSHAAELWLRRELRFRDLSTAWFAMTPGPNFTTAKEIATTSPEGAVILAFADVEKVVRAAWTIDYAEPHRSQDVATMIRDLTRRGLESDFAVVAENLFRLRNRVTHGDATVSTAGALDFIGACERLTDALTSLALSKLRHPSRSTETADWLRWAEQQAQHRGPAQDDEASDDAGPDDEEPDDEEPDDDTSGGSLK